MKILNNILIFFLIQSILTEDLSTIFKVQLGNIAIFLSIIYILLNFKYLQVNKLMVFCILFILVTSNLALLFSFNTALLDIFRMFKVNSAILFVLLGNIIMNQKDEKLVKTGIISFIIFISILIIQNFKLLINLDSTTRLFSMDYLFFSLETVNLFHAMIAFNLCLFIAINRYFHFYSRSIEILFSLIISLFILLSLVRTAYIIIVIIFIVYFIYQNFKEKKYFSFSIACIFALLGIIVFKESGYFNRIMYTFNGSVSSKLDNSSFYRIQLFKNVVSEMSKSPKLSLFGYGFKDFSNININTLGLESTHNGFLNLFVKGGILYVLSFITFGLYLARRYITNLNTIVLIIIFTLINFTGDGITYIPLQQMFFLYLGFINGGNNGK
ncbi:O-antigen ligase family protein [Macrococcoides canis]|uniref:O-Antigen ligase n=1 Tax=Macrococcoides canis TaxID=1855823 RepID=A0A1W7AA89_9STAP|nr:O-antigen ligase family protein [Macrococcus canis]ARQ06537.1 O-Antigen ligase [Macrococcus canis]